MATRRTTGSARTAEGSPTAGEKAATSRRRTSGVQSATASGASAGSTVSADARRAMIEQSAYLRAERRGFTAGGEVEDWLAAETEVDALLEAGNGSSPQ